MSSADSNATMQLVVATILLGVGVVGIVSALLDRALFEPVYAAVAFGAAAAVYPNSPTVGCWLRDRLSE
jgi:hypothetical protein